MMETSAMQLITEIHSIVKWTMPKKSITEMFAMLLIQVKPFVEYLYPNELFLPIISEINIYATSYFLSVSTEGIEEKWSRDCNFLEPNTTVGLGCDQHKIDSKGHEITVDICFCGSSLCNKEMGPIPTTTPSSTSKVSTTTTKGNAHIANVSRHRNEIYDLTIYPFRDWTQMLLL